MFGQFLVKYLVVPLAVKVLPQIAEELVQVIRGALEKEAADAVKEGPDQAPLPNPNVEITYTPYRKTELTIVRCYNFYRRYWVARNSQLILRVG